MKINFNFSTIKDSLIDFLNSANTPREVYLKFGILSLIVVVPCFLITIRSIYSYSNHKKASTEESDAITKNKNTIMELATVATELLSEDKKIEKGEINFLTDLGKIAEDTDNEITNFKPLPKKIVTAGENIEAFPVELELLGSFPTLINFLEQIKKYDRICIIEKMEMKTGKLNYPYIETSLRVVLFPLVRDTEEIKEPGSTIRNDPFKPFYYRDKEVSIKKRTGDINLTGIIREKYIIWAIIEIGGKGYIVKKGNSIGENIKITNISSDSVYLTENEKTIVLKLEGNK